MTQLPAHFANRQRRDLFANITRGIGTAAPPTVSIMGSSFTLIDSNGEKSPVETKHLDVVIIDANPNPTREYWERFDPDNSGPPICFSDNGIGASANAQSPQSETCQSCKWNGWGSATSQVTGKPTKACSTKKKIAVLAVEGKTNNDNVYGGDTLADFPFLLRVPVMSLENLRAYSAQFNGQEFDVSQVVTRIKFAQGAVGKLTFEVVGFIDERTDKLVNKILDSNVTDNMVGKNDPVFGGGQAKVAAAAPTQRLEVKKAEPEEEKEEAPPPKKVAKKKPAVADEGPRKAPFLNNDGSGVVADAPEPSAEVQAKLASLFK